MVYCRGVGHETTRPTLWTSGLCLLLAFAVLGHICVLPGHSHAAPAPAADHDHHDRADDAVHEASCQAIATSSLGTPLAPELGVIGVTEQSVIQLLPATPAAIVRLPAVKTRRGPPLFLLHASLLI